MADIALMFDATSEDTNCGGCCPIRVPFGESGALLDSILVIHTMGGQSASIAYKRRLLSFGCWGWGPLRVSASGQRKLARRNRIGLVGRFRQLPRWHARDAGNGYCVTRTV